MFYLFRSSLCVLVSLVLLDLIFCTYVISQIVGNKKKIINQIYDIKGCKNMAFYEAPRCEADEVVSLSRDRACLLRARISRKPEEWLIYNGEVSN